MKKLKASHDSLPRGAKLLPSVLPYTTNGETIKVRAEFFGAIFINGKRENEGEVFYNDFHGFFVLDRYDKIVSLENEIKNWRPLQKPLYKRLLDKVLKKKN
jgi:hypothetical protein